MTRTLTITALERASAQDGTLWLVREASYDGSHVDGLYPPAEFVLACAPCGTCGGSRCVVPPNCDCDKVTSLNYALCNHPPADCPDCRIEMVGPCLGRNQPDHVGFNCPTWCTWGCNGSGNVTLGYAYAIGQPLPIYSDSTMPHERPYEYLAVKLWSLSMGGNHTYRLTMYRRNGGGGYSVTPAFAQKANQQAAHYGPPESLVGKWALQVQVTA